MSSNQTRLKEYRVFSLTLLHSALFMLPKLKKKMFFISIFHRKLQSIFTSLQFRKLY